MTLRLTDHVNAIGEVLDEEWSDIVRSLPDLLTVIDEHAVILDVSPSCVALLGRSPSELVGRSCCEFIGHDDRRNCAAWLSHARSLTTSPALVHRLLRQDGTTAIFETRLQGVSDANGTARFVALSRDITDHAQADELNALHAQAWEDVCESMAHGLVVVNSAGAVVAANNRARTVLDTPLPIGRNIGEFLAGSPIDLHTPSKVTPTLRLEDDAAVAAEMRSCRGPNGATTWLRIKIVPLTSATERTPDRRWAILLEPADSDASSEMSPPAHTESLSPRETEVLRLLSDGYDVRHISDRLGVSIHTVRGYVKAILRKLHVRTQLQAVVLAARTGMLNL